MIDFTAAKKYFLNYVSTYNQEDGRVQLKLTHTFGVVEMSELIAKQLALPKEDIQLAKMIALLHDIGRFEQAIKYQDFADHKTMDHAVYGIQILEEKNMLRHFVSSCKYDEIIKQAIHNHNRYEIQKGLDSKSLLHAKIIRDADKLDNFRVKIQDDLLYISNFTKEQLEQDVISAHILSSFLSSKAILSKDRKTSLDMWVSYLAFLFDINFTCSLKYIKEHNYINLLADRLDYQKEETRMQMSQIKMHANVYLNQRISFKE